LWQLYLCGALVTAVGALVVTDRFSEHEEPVPRTGLIALAAVLWPVVVVGLMQLILIAGLAKAMRVADALLGSPVTSTSGGLDFGSLTVAVKPAPTANAWLLENAAGFANGGSAIAKLPLPSAVAWLKTPAAKALVSGEAKVSVGAGFANRDGGVGKAK
jgi:hypothetical protein